MATPAPAAADGTPPAGPSRVRRRAAGLLGILLAGCAATTGHDAAHGTAGDPAAHRHAAGGTPPADTRQPVPIPEPLRSHMMANMRDHLQALAEIQAALADADFDRAAELAERRLGLSSLASHGAHEVARFMPGAMQEAGTAMHRSASRFAAAAKDASATGELRPALHALARLQGACVACHAGFRLP